MFAVRALEAGPQNKIVHDRAAKDGSAGATTMREGVPLTVWTLRTGVRGG